MGGTCLLPAELCCWMLTSYGFGVTARISFQLPVDEAKRVPILPRPPNRHLQALENNKQTNKNQNRTGGCGAINEGDCVLDFLAMESSKQGVM